MRLLDRVDPEPYLGSRAVVWFVSAMAGIGGLGEAIYRSVRQLLVPQPATEYQWELLWMSPLAAAMAGTVLGAVLVLAARLLSRGVGTRNVTVLGGLLVIYPVIQQPTIPLHWAADILLSLGCAIAVADRLRGRLRDLERDILANRSYVLVVMAVLLFTGVGGRVLAFERWRLADRPVPTSAHPSVLLIVLDTERAANFSLYGYARETTPWLNEWGAGGVVFERAYATASWTLPSHGSFFTGRYANELSADFRRPLGAEFPTLAEVLARHGYVTAGFVANVFYASRMSGLQRGFDRYEALPVDRNTFARSSWASYGLVRRTPYTGRLFDFDRKSATEIVERFLAWESTRPSDRPYFAFLNVWDAHAPYTPPPDYAELFGLSPAEPWDYVFSTWGLFPDSTYTSARVSLWQNRYDAALRYVDDSFRTMFDSLEARGTLDNTVVIVTSDHGEMWGERGQIDHATSLYLPLLHVPLVIRSPESRDAPRRVPDAVSLRDLPATILDLVGLSAGSPLPGSSLRSLWQDSVPRIPPSLPRADLGVYPQDVARLAAGIANWAPAMRGPMFSIVDDSLQYILNGDGVEELYDVRRDPKQERDLIGAPGAAAELDRLRGLRDSLRLEPVAPGTAR